jgi:hypothetical protein
VRIGLPAVDLECEALVRAVRRDDPSGDRLLEALGADINWPRLLDLSVRHRVMPLLCARLQSLGPQNPAPREIMAGLKTLRRINEGKNLLLTMKLAEILDVFGRNGVEAIALKGPALAAAAYGSVGMRQFDDLDILIRPRDYACVKSLMAGLGFRPDKEFTPAQEAVHLRRHHAFRYKDAQSGIFIDIHIRLTETFHKIKLETESLFTRRIVVVSEGYNLPSLSAGDALIHLCVHGALNAWQALGMICDVAAVVASGGVWLWGEVLDKARKTGLRRTVLLGLGLAQDATRIDLPMEVESQIRADKGATNLKRRVLADLLPGRTAQLPLFELALFFLKSKERMSDKLGFFLKRLALPSPEDWKAIRLPDLFYILYIPVRAFRISAKVIFPGLVKWARRSLRSRRIRPWPDSG